jgi:hypothetical protein
MIEKFYAAHIKTTLDASVINARKPKRTNRERKGNGAATPPPARATSGALLRRLGTQEELSSAMRADDSKFSLVTAEDVIRRNQA